MATSFALSIFSSNPKPPTPSSLSFLYSEEGRLFVFATIEVAILAAGAKDTSRFLEFVPMLEFTTVVALY
ncbi:hypothetical protein HN51_069960, partial [Arachis hypogaea]